MCENFSILYSKDLTQKDATFNYVQELNSCILCSVKMYCSYKLQKL